MIFQARAALGAALFTCVLFTGVGFASAGETSSIKKTLSGFASWYGSQFHGRLTANGERFDMNGLTAAHRSLPFGSKVRVTNRDKSVVVRINDRGPYVGKRLIDLSRGAAKALNIIGSGVARVKLEVLRRGDR